MEVTRMKKILAVLLVLLVSMSILPITFAQGGATNQAKNLGKDTSATISERNIPVELKTQAQDRFREAKLNFETHKQQYTENRANVIKAKNDLKNCLNKDTNCEKEREQLRIQTRALLTNVADLYIKHMEQIKEKAQLSNALTEGEINAVLESIDSKINELNELKTGITQAETNEKLINVLRDFKEKIKEIKVEAKYNVQHLNQNRVGLIIQQSEQLEIKLKAILASLAERNIEIKEISPLIDEFNAKIAEARQYYQESMELFAKSKDASNTEKADLMKQANDKVIKAQRSLQEARNILSKIVEQIRIKTNANKLEVNYNKGLIQDRLVGPALVNDNNKTPVGAKNTEKDIKTNKALNQ